MYQVSIYHNDILHHYANLPNALSAINYAYNDVCSWGPFRVAHIIKIGANHGIYIARHDDPERRGWSGINGAVQQLESIKWEL